MEKKINLVELLKDCPKGMKLYSPIFGDVYLDKIRPHLAIVVTTDKEQGNLKAEFLYDGRYGMNGECMLFPSKGKTTWEGFVPSCKFKDGDILYAVDEGKEFIFILKHIFEHGKVYCYLSLKGNNLRTQKIWLTNYNHTHRLATKEEKQKLFDAIKANGYRWNAETKTLEKLIEPKFKVGDRIKHVVGREEIATVVGVEKLHYNLDSKVGTSSFSISLQREWELVPNKFDITTLKAFESRVLVRDNDNDIWYPAIFGKYSDKNMTYRIIVVGGLLYKQCIPYENNEHLLNTTNDCDDYYKTW